jgi:hypothetical protein
VTHYKHQKGVEMSTKAKTGIIIFDRYRRCAGGKCFRAIANREDPAWKPLLEPTMADEATRLAYN